MIDFPEEPIFICRKCLNRFTPNLPSASCPACGHSERHQKDLKNFIKFYPRMLAAIPAMANNGFKLTSYGIYIRPTVNMYGFDSLSFECSSCGAHNKIPVERVSKLAASPGLFYCRHCKTNPSLNKVTKELFMSVNNVHKGALLIVSYQWDLFSPVGFDPDDAAVRFGVPHTAD
ncbi:hypothetical protein [Desulfuromonas acetoxidans]|uniref:hypothetical protein n=1 Tax=Desulfuromonas acetoxidans TaxID=891 RepID=UPI00292FA767|nr:hypothetical protein [Desulfuromonas acetoxidans]